MQLQDGSHSDQFGVELVLDLYDCDITTFATEQQIKDFVIKLCDDIIEMKRFGEPQVPHFGHDDPITSGFSLVQLIETSLVSAHFSEFKKAVYLNIFSCKWFDTNKTVQFCQTWFKAQKVNLVENKRQ